MLDIAAAGCAHDIIYGYTRNIINCYVRDTHVDSSCVTDESNQRTIRRTALRSAPAKPTNFECDHRFVDATLRQSRPVSRIEGDYCHVQTKPTYSECMDALISQCRHSYDYALMIS